MLLSQIAPRGCGSRQTAMIRPRSSLPSRQRFSIDARRRELVYLAQLPGSFPTASTVAGAGVRGASTGR